MGTRLAALLSIGLAWLSVGCDGDEADVTPPPYGGELMISHLRLADGSNELRVGAYFIATQDPDLAPAEVPLGQCGPDLRSVQADSREYIDVGDTLTVRLAGGDYVAPRLVADPDRFECGQGACVNGVVDYAGRTHEIAYLRDSFTSPEVADGFPLAESSVTTAEPQSFSDQIRILQPPIIEVESPTFDFTPSVVVLPTAEDLVLDWQQSEPADDLTVTITFTPDGATTPTTCRVADTGSFTVPADLIEGLEADSGWLSVYSVNSATATTDEGRVIDVRAEYHGNYRYWEREVSTTAAP